MAVTSDKTTRVARRYWPLAVGLALVALMLAGWAAAPAADWIKTIGGKVAELGWAAPLAYLVLYAMGTIILAPSPLMSIAAGVAFGWWGLPLAVLGATAGATASFVISRYFLDDDLEEWLTDRRIFRAAKHAVDDEGWRIQVLLRLSPVVPFGLLNYLLGLTKTPLTTYILATAIGVIPGSFADIYIGVIGQSLAGGEKIAYLAAGAIVTIICAAVITFKARSSLRDAGLKA